MDAQILSITEGMFPCIIFLQSPYLLLIYSGSLYRISKLGFSFATVLGDFCRGSGHRDPDLGCLRVAVQDRVIRLEELLRYAQIAGLRLAANRRLTSHQSSRWRFGLRCGIARGGCYREKFLTKN